MFTVVLKKKTPKTKISPYYHLISENFLKGDYAFLPNKEDPQREAFFIVLPAVSEHPFEKGKFIENHLSIDKYYQLHTTQRGANGYCYAHYTAVYEIKNAKEKKEKIKIHVRYGRDHSILGTFSKYNLTPQQIQIVQKNAKEASLFILIKLEIGRIKKYHEAMKEAENFEEELATIFSNSQTEVFYKTYLEKSEKFIEAIKKINLYNDLEIDSRDLLIKSISFNIQTQHQENQSRSTILSQRADQAKEAFEETSDVLVQPNKTKKPIEKQLYEADWKILKENKKSAQLLSVGILQGNLEEVEKTFLLFKDYIKEETYSKLLDQIVNKTASADLQKKQIQVCNYLYENSFLYRSVVYLKTQFSRYDFSPFSTPELIESSLFSQAVINNNRPAFQLLLTQNHSELQKSFLLRSLIIPVEAIKTVEKKIFFEALLNYSFDFNILPKWLLTESIRVKKEQLRSEGKKTIIKKHMIDYPLFLAIKHEQYHLAEALIGYANLFELAHVFSKLLLENQEYIQIEYSLREDLSGVLLESQEQYETLEKYYWAQNPQPGFYPYVFCYFKKETTQNESLQNLKRLAENLLDKLENKAQSSNENQIIKAYEKVYEFGESLLQYKDICPEYSIANISAFFHAALILLAFQGQILQEKEQRDTVKKEFLKYINNLKKTCVMIDRTQETEDFQKFIRFFEAVLFNWRSQGFWEKNQPSLRQEENITEKKKKKKKKIKKKTF